MMEPAFNHTTDAMKYNVLVIEDNRDIAHLVQLHLKDIQCDSDIATDGEHGLALFNQHDYDLVVLDLMLPGMDGLDVCRQLRAQPGYVPILMLTAKATELDRVLGLEVGADDYLTKPFSIAELVARIKALFRRVEAFSQRQSDAAAAATGTLTFGSLHIDTDKRLVTIADCEITLTAKEFDLLLHFARHPGRVFTRSQLLDQVWGYHHAGYEHTVNSHINRLRAKIEDDPAKPQFILTVWGVGYKFNDSLA